MASKIQGSQDRSKVVQCLEHSLLALFLLEHLQQFWREVKDRCCKLQQQLKAMEWYGKKGVYVNILYFTCTVYFSMSVKTLLSVYAVPTVRSHHITASYGWFTIQCCTMHCVVSSLQHMKYPISSNFLATRCKNITHWRNTRIESESILALCYNIIAMSIDAKAVQPNAWSSI